MALAWAIDEDAGQGHPRQVPAALHGSESGRPLGDVVRPIEGNAPRSLSVLVVDDDAALRSSLSTILESAGHRVVEAANGEIALNELHGQGFDVLVVDLHMPKTDGLAVIRQIEVPPPIVIICSAFAYYSEGAVREEVGAKVFRFLQKPVPPLEMIAAVNEAAAELDD